MGLLKIPLPVEQPLAGIPLPLSSSSEVGLGKGGLMLSEGQAPSVLWPSSLWHFCGATTVPQL